MAGGTLKNIEVLNDGAFALRAADYVSAKALAASTAESITVPENANHALLAGTEHFYAHFTTTAVVPADTADGTFNELNPDMRTRRAFTATSVITPAHGGPDTPPLHRRPSSTARAWHHAAVSLPAAP